MRKRGGINGGFKPMRNLHKFKSAALSIFITASGAMPAQAQPVVLPPNPTAPNLRTAAGFAVLAGSTITAGGGSKVSGTGSHRFGIANGIAFLGAANVIDLQSGDIFLNVAPAPSAQADAQTAWTLGNQASVAGSTVGGNTTLLATGELGGVTYKRGFYSVGNSATGARAPEAFTLVTSMTLDGQDDPDSVFIFETYAAMAVTAGMKVNLTGGAQAKNVYWLIGAGFETGTDVSFSGTVIAKDPIILGARTVFNGQLLGLAGTSILLVTGVEIINNGPIPEPGTYGAAMGAAVLGIVMMRRRKPRGSR